MKGHGGLLKVVFIHSPGRGFLGMPGGFTRIKALKTEEFRYL